MPPPTAPVTLRQIAAAAGVTHPTVSLALRNDPRISAATRRRIQQLAREMRYRPDPALSALVAYRQRRAPVIRREKIAILNTWEGALFPGFFLEQLSGIEQRAFELGYETEIFAVPRNEKAQRSLGRVLKARGIRAVLVGPMPADRPTLSMDWNAFIPVTIGHSLREPRLPFVASNHYLAVAIAYDKLRRLGYRRIGFHSTASGQDRIDHAALASYLRCLHQDGISSDALPPFLVGPRPADATAGWMQSHRIEAVMGMSAYEPLRKAGYRFPRDAGLISLSSPNAHLPEIAAVRQDQGKLGAAAMRLLHDRILLGERGVPAMRQAILIDPQWHPGRTVGRPGRRGATRTI